MFKHWKFKKYACLGIVALIVLSGLGFARDAYSADRHLVLVGGGDSPPSAMARYVEWSGGAHSKILIVTWATEVPAETYSDMVSDLAPYHPGGFLWSKLPPKTSIEKAAFLSLLNQATGVFFSGGDQKRIFEVLEDREILTSIQRRYEEGVAFAGTSAGTAIMSSIAIAGGDPEAIDGKLVPVGTGLGLLQDAIVDQHFIRRSRENRLFGVILDHPSLLGLGIDEGTSIAIENGRCGQVIGPGAVMMVDALRVPGSLVVTLAASGQFVDLLRRERTSERCF
jgi:cyanophycinase